MNRLSSVFIFAITSALAVHSGLCADAPQINDGGIVNLADYKPTIAPGDIVSLFGVSFAANGSAFVPTGPPPLPPQLGGVQVLVNGNPAPLYYVSATQINIQMPLELPPGQTATVQVVSNGQPGNISTIPVLAIAPRVLFWAESTVAGNRPIAVNSDGSLTLADSKGLAPFKSHPARPGDTLTFYAVGLGQTNPPASTGTAAPSVEPFLRVAQVSMSISGNGTTVEVPADFAGLTPGLVGLYQVNLKIPANAPVGDRVPFTLKVNGVVGNEFEVPVAADPANSTTTLPSGTVGVAYSASVAALATGGTPPYAFSASGLPAGLAMAADGLVTGIPTAAGTSTAVFTFIDSSSPSHVTGTGNVTITINTPQSLTITSVTPPTGAVGVAYSASPLSVAGGTAPYSFSATGLPAGLSMDASGAISGTPTTSGSSTATVTVTDSSSPAHLSATTTLTIAIAGPGLAITTTSLPGGAVGTTYPTTTVTATGGTAPYSFTATGLPTGLSMDANGVISGTPTAAGTSTVNLTVTDSGSPSHMTATASVGITITPPVLAIATTSLPAGAVGIAYPATAVIATGGTPPYSFSATGLPAGLSMDASGVISGTPTAPGTSTAGVNVTDSSTPTHLTATATLSIVVTGPALAISTTSLPGGTVGVAYPATTVTATGGKAPYSFTATGLPAGLSISTGGVISGTPTAPGTSTAQITVTDSATPVATVTAGLSIVIAAAAVPLSITTSSLPAGTVQSAYSATLAATGGKAPYHWALTGGTLPAGLSLDPNSGVIGGTPTAAAANAALTFTVTDSGAPAQTASVNLPLTINGVVVSGTSIQVDGATVGNNLQFPVQVTLSPPLSADTQITLAVDNPALVTLAAHALDPGAGSLTLLIPAGSNSFSIFAQGLANSGSATLTVSAPGYSNGSSQILLAPSAFVISGPNGIGASFTTSQGITTALTVSAGRLDGAGNFVQAEGIKGGSTFNVPVSVVNSSGGSVAPGSLTFTGDIDSLPVQFTAGTSAVSTTIAVNQPGGFSTPAGTAGNLPVTVQATAIIPGNVTVGQNLEATTIVALQGAAADDLTVTIVSGDPAKLLLSTDGVTAGSASITRLIKAGANSTPPFYVYGVGNSGTVTYNASAPGFGNANGTVTLGKSGFVLASHDFLTTRASAASDIRVQAALLDGGGNPVGAQNVAGGLSFNVNVTSSNTAVGKITSSPVTINGGNNEATTQFQPLTDGTAVISVAGPAPFVVPAQLASITATVTTPRVLISADSVGNHLQQHGQITLATSPATDLPVTLTVTAGSATLSTTGTAAGSNSINVTIPAGNTIGSFTVYGGASSGVAIISATAPGFDPGTASVQLVPSGVIMADSLLGGISTTVAAGSQPVKVSTVKLDPGGIALQPLAGGSSLSVGLLNSDATVGTIPATATIAGGSDTGTVQFTPLKAGSTTVTATQPAGYTTPSQFTTLQVVVH